MINAGVDAFQTDAGNSQIGVIETANEAGVYVSGDVSDNSALCPDGFYAYMGIDFGENIYLAVKQLVEGNFPGGEHGYMNIASGTYFVDTALLDALAEKMPEKADKFQAAKEAPVFWPTTMSRSRSGRERSTASWGKTAPASPPS